MTGAEFIKKNKDLFGSPAEEAFIHNVFIPLLGTDLLEKLQPQFKLQDPGTGRKYKLDFVIESSGYKYNIEIDGLWYHDLLAMGDHDRHNYLHEKKSYTTSQEFIIIEITQDDCTHNPDRAMIQLRRGVRGDSEVNPYFREKKLLPPQKKGLENVLHYLNIDNGGRALLVMATGMGKTFVSANIAKYFNARTLFIAHRHEILEQAQATYQLVWEDVSTGKYAGQNKHRKADVVFASIQTMYQNYKTFKESDFDLIIIDEFHHAAAPSYRKVIDYFKPRYLIGMTATPFRTDRQDLLELCGYRIAFEYDFEEAMLDAYLAPVSYYLLEDDIDYSSISRQSGKYKISGVSSLERNLLIPERDKAVLKEYQHRIKNKRTIAFCVNKNHCKRMAKFFNNNGISSSYIIDETPLEKRRGIIKDFQLGTIFLVFAVDIFNEGIDIPETEALMFLRPTESKLILLQQLGRGLRLSPGKWGVDVLDFVGRNQHGISSIARLFGINKKDIDEKLNEAKEKGKEEITIITDTGEVTFQIVALERFKRAFEEEEGVAREDLEEYYFYLKTKLKRKPQKHEINLDDNRPYRVRDYEEEYGSWINFLKTIGERVLSDDHVYFQNGDIRYIYCVIKRIGDNNIDFPFDPYSFYDSMAPKGKGSRQSRYVLRMCMGLGLIKTDFKRDQYPIEEQTYDYQELTLLGTKLYDLLCELTEEEISPFYNIASSKKGKTLSWQTEIDTRNAIDWTSNLEAKHPELFHLMRHIFINKAEAVKHMLKYILHEERNNKISREKLVDGSMFEVPFIKEFLEDQGMTLTEKSQALAEHRLPKLVGFLQSIKFATGYGSSEITIKILPLIKELLLKIDELMGHDANEIFERRRDFVKKYFDRLREKPNARVETVIEEDEEADDMVVLRTLFGGSFLTPKYPIKSYIDISEPS
ncbi:DEAD/DEAH box helicase [Thermodesulfobacteriota bacterium]